MEALATAPKPSTALENMAAIVGELARVKSRQDVGAALAIYHPDGVLLSPPLDARAEGAEPLRKGFSDCRPCGRQAGCGRAAAWRRAHPLPGLAGRRYPGGAGAVGSDG